MALSSLAQAIKSQLDSGISASTGLPLTSAQRTSLEKQFLSAAGYAYSATTSSSVSATPTTTTTGQLPAGVPAPTSTDLASAARLSAYVLKYGLTNLQNYDWWKNSPYKDAAWSIINGGSTSTNTNTQTNTQTSSGGTTTNAPTNVTTSTGLTYTATDNPYIFSLPNTAYGKLYYIKNPITGQFETAGSPTLEEAKKLFSNRMTLPQSRGGYSTNPNIVPPTQADKASAEAMAAYVKKWGLTDLQYLDWWSTSPYKNDAWTLVQGGTLQGGTNVQAEAPENDTIVAGDTGATSDNPLPFDPSSITINTGDPIADEYLNYVLNNIWDSYSGMLTTLPHLTDSLIAKLEQEIDNNFGGKLTEWKNEVQKSYDVGKQSLAEQLAIARRQNQYSQQRGQEDVSRLTGQINEDVETQKRVLGRNYQEALNDTQFSYQQAGRTLSGKRFEAERKLSDINQENLRSIDTTAQRNIGSLNTQQQRLLQDLALSERSLANQQMTGEASLNQQLTDANRQIADYRQSLIDTERQNLEQLPYNYLSMLTQQPSWAAAAPEVTASTASTPNTSVTTPSVSTTPAPTINSTMQVASTSPYTTSTPVKKVALADVSGNGAWING